MNITKIKKKYTINHLCNYYVFTVSYVLQLVSYVSYYLMVYLKPVVYLEPVYII